MRRSLSAAIVLLVLTCNPAGAEPIDVTSGLVVFTDEPGDSFSSDAASSSGARYSPRRSAAPSGSTGVTRIYWRRVSPGCAYRLRHHDVRHRQGDQGSGASGASCTRSCSTAANGRSMGRASLHLRRSTSRPRQDGPFAFEGSIFAYPTESRTGMPLFSASLRGGGTARVFFGANTFGVSGPRLILHDLHYVFETQPVPEPSTLLLVGAGLGAALSRCRRRSHLSTGAGLEERAGTATQSSSDQSP